MAYGSTKQGQRHCPHTSLAIDAKQRDAQHLRLLPATSACSMHSLSLATQDHSIHIDPATHLAPMATKGN